MAKVLEDLTVKVTAKLDVDRSTAEGCLKLVEVYCNENHRLIACDEDENGKLIYKLC